ncbi:MAG: ABC transporter permease subunit [Geminicoccales bacterium]
MIMMNGVQLLLLPRTGRYNLLGTGVEDIAGTYLSGAAAWALVLIGITLFAALKISTLMARRRAGLTAPLARDLILPVAIVGVLAIAALLLLSERNGLPMPLILFITVLGVTAYVTTETRFGLHLYAVGNSVEAARRSGINVARIKIMAFAIAGGLAALAGILAASRILGVSVSSGGGIGGGALLLESIAAAVIGGVSLFGGRGRVTGALFGALIIATVSNGLNLMGVANEAV